MSLFTTPMTLNDGVADRIFSFLRQEPDSNVIVAKYIEDAAAVADESQLVVRHDERKTVKRHLLQRRIYMVPAASVDGEPELVTINFTVNAPGSFTVAELLPEFVLTKDALNETDFLANLLAGKI